MRGHSTYRHESRLDFYHLSPSIYLQPMWVLLLSTRAECQRQDACVRYLGRP